MKVYEIVVESNNGLLNEAKYNPVGTDWDAAGGFGIIQFNAGEQPHAYDNKRDYDRALRDFQKNGTIRPGIGLSPTDRARISDYNRNTSEANKKLAQESRARFQANATKWLRRTGWAGQLISLFNLAGDLRVLNEQMTACWTDYTNGKYGDPRDEKTKALVSKLEGMIYGSFITQVAADMVGVVAAGAITVRVVNLIRTIVTLGLLPVTGPFAFALSWIAGMGASIGVTYLLSDQTFMKWLISKALVYDEMGKFIFSSMELFGGAGEIVIDAGESAVRNTLGDESKIADALEKAKKVNVTQGSAKGPGGDSGAVKFTGPEDEIAIDDEPANTNQPSSAPNAASNSSSTANDLFKNVK